MITEHLRLMALAWRINHYGEGLVFAFALSIIIFGLWPIRMLRNALRRRRQEKRMIKYLRRSRLGY